MNNLTIRRATLTDTNALTPLFDGYRRFYQCESDIPAAKEFLQDRLSQGESVVFIAERGETAVGFCQLFPSFSSAAMARTYILNDLFVQESARRQGVASKLMQAAVDFARAEGAVRVTLSTAVTNEAAQALYQSQRWKRDEQFFVYHFFMPATEEKSDSAD